MKRTSIIGFIFASIISLAITLSAFASHQSPQDEQKADKDQDSVRLSATLVQVPAIVTDRTGKLVTDLTQKDFTVYEDGKQQPVAMFATVKQPFNAVLLLDTSNSAQDRLRAIQSTAASFTHQLEPKDQMMVISFDNEIRQLTDFTNDAKELEAAIRGTESGFGKLLYEAVTRALEQLRDREGRRAVILFSDGVDMRSIEATVESSTRLAEEIGAVIYVVRFDTRWWLEAEARSHEAERSKTNLPGNIDGRIPLPPEFGGPEVPSNPEIPAPKAPRIEIGGGGIEVGSPRRQPPVVYDPGNVNTPTRRVPEPEMSDPLTKNLNKLYGEANAYLQTLTSRTGGRIFEAETFETTRSAFARIADEMRNLYMLGYYPPTNRRDNKYHKIKLEVARKDVQVRARTGYRAEGNKQ
ncbi:MAG TPA: VWA domain-containing protein [Blastocatellia bacterium]|nr:VWA domain-containing protein [Blastocatellia bacterium]